MAGELEMSIGRRHLRRGLAAVGLTVFTLHLLVFVFDRFDLFGETLVRRLGNLGAENTFPTWLAAVLLLAVAVLCWAVGRAAPEDSRYWYVLAVGVGLMSIDEVSSFHEALTGPVRRLVGMEGIFYYAWIVPAIIVVLVALALFWKFLFRLPPGLRNQLFVAAGVFVLGAVGFEMAEGIVTSGGGRDSVLFNVLVTVEEMLELLAMAIALDALVAHLARQSATLTVQFTDP